MLNKNLDSFFGKDFFIKHSIMFNFSFFFFNIYKYTAIYLLLSVRFSQFSNFFFTVYTGLFLPFIDFKTKVTIFSSEYVDNNNIQNITNIFSSISTSKKNILIAVAQKKRTNLFKKYNSYKRSLFYDAYATVKSSFLLNNRKTRFFYNFKFENELFNPLDTAFNFSKNTPENANKFSQTNYSFFKKFFFNKKIINKPFLHKKHYLYRMHKKFSVRYYANRLIFKHVFLPEKSKQFTITRFVENFKTHKIQNFYKQIQLFLFSTLLSSQFFFFKTDCFYFIKHYGVFINGKICTNPYKVLVPGDVLQLPVISSYFFFLKKFDNISFFFFKKYTAKFHRMFASRKKRFRTKSRHLPN